jgi:hypothetical protein
LFYPAFAARRDLSVVAAIPDPATESLRGRGATRRPKKDTIMKVLTATSCTQGQRGNDFHWCIEGELVHFGMVCAADRADPDGGCGCGRAFAGLNSHRATTTAMIREIERFTRDDYIEAIRSSLSQQGWDPGTAEDEADELISLIWDWPVGAVAERRLDRVAVRLVTTPPG